MRQSVEALSRAQAAALWVVLGLLCLAPWVMSLAVVGVGGHDDSHITFYVARELSETGRYINYNGESAEQSSSMALVVVLALLHATFGIGLPLLGYLVGLFFSSAAVVLTYMLCLRLTAGPIQRRAALGLLGAAICSTTWCFLYWATTGMETSFAAAAAAALLLAMMAYEAEPTRPSRIVAWVVSLAFFLTVRPENVLIAPCVAVALLIVCRFGEDCWRKSAAWLVAAPAALSLIRWALFDSALPRTVLAKSGGFRIRDGLGYLGDSILASNGALYAAAAVALAVTLWRLARGTLPAALAAASALLFAQLVFVVSVGGDWMKHGRFLVPTVPIAAALGVAVLSRLGNRFAYPLMAAVLVTGIAQTYRAAEERQPWLIPYRDANSIADEYPPLAKRFSLTELGCLPHLRDAPLVLVLEDWLDRLEQRLDRPIVVASGQTGMVAYYATKDREVDIVDLWDLTTGDITSCEPEAIAFRAVYGSRVDFDWLLGGKLEEKCGVPAPDIVYEHRYSVDARRALHEYGYKTVYRQYGTPRGKRFPRYFQRPGFIAVRKDLLTDAEAASRTEMFNWARPKTFPALSNDN
ncbi:MAG: hypothetical protein AAF500_22475 [Myxococcota bacterium]